MRIALIYNYWLVHEFFCVTFSFWDMIDFVYGHFWCMCPHVCKRLKRFCKPDSDVNLTGEARVLNRKACGVQGRNPGEGCGVSIFFFSQMDKLFFNKKNSKVVTFTWKMRNVLKRVKNQFISYFGLFLKKYKDRNVKF